MRILGRDVRVGVATVVVIAAFACAWVVYAATRPEAMTSGGGTAGQHTASQFESKARSLLAKVMATQPQGRVTAAAYVQANYADFAAAQVDMAGLPSSPATADILVIVEVDGWFPYAHSAPAGNAGNATGILAPYDVTTGVGLPWTYAFDPLSPDVPGASAGSVERFALLRHYGMPNLLAVP
jgi:hypothetical protein